MKRVAAASILIAVAFASSVARAGAPAPLQAPQDYTGQGHVITTLTQQTSHDTGVGIGTSGNNLCPTNANCTNSGTDNFTGTFQKNGVTQTFPTSGAILGASDAQVISGKSIAGDANTLANIPNSALVNPQVTVGGQVTALGGATNNQGNGGKIQLSTGTTTTGDCAKYDAFGNVIDATFQCALVSGSSGSIQTNNGSGNLGSVAAPSGAIVGTTDTQVISGKSIDASEVNSGFLNFARLPANQFTGVAALTASHLAASNAFEVYLVGYYAGQTGGDGLLYKVACAVNNGTCFADADGQTWARESPRWSVDEWGAKSDWTTAINSILGPMQTAALAANKHRITFVGTSFGDGWRLNNFTVVPGMEFYCVGQAPAEATVAGATAGDFRNYPNALVMGQAGGLLVGNGFTDTGCSLVTVNLATTAPPTDYQSKMARVLAYTGIGITCADFCTLTDVGLYGFDKLFKFNGTRSASFTRVYGDGNTCFSMVAAKPSGLIGGDMLHCNPYGTPFGTPSVTATGFTDNGGLLHVSFPTCTGGNCPFETYPVCVNSPGSTQSAQGCHNAIHVTSTDADLQGTTSAFITGGLSQTGSIVMGSRVITGLTQGLFQINPTQALTVPCFPSGTKVSWVNRIDGWVIASVPAVKGPGCTGTPQSPQSVTVNIADDAQGSLDVSSATLNQPGLAYQPGDVLTLVGGTFTEAATVTVDDVDAVTGAIIDFELTDQGNYTALPGPTNVATTGGSGTGATVDVSSAATLYLYAGIRSGPALDIAGAAPNVVNFQELGHVIGISIGQNANGVVINGCNLHDENLLQDQTHYGILLHGNAKANYVHCGSFYAGGAAVDQTTAATFGAANVIDVGLLAGSSGNAGLQNLLFQSSSSAPGTPKKTPTIFRGNFYKGGGVAFISDDSFFTSLTDDVFPQAELWGQSDATSAKVEGISNFGGGNLQIFAKTPNLLAQRVAPTTTADLYSHCGDAVTSSAAGGSFTDHLPIGMPIGCRLTYRPNVNAIIVDPSGNTINRQLAGLPIAQATPIILLAGISTSQVSLTWDGSRWNYDGGTPNLTYLSGFGDGQVATQGQVYFSCKGTCSGGTGQAQMFPVGGPGGLSFAGTLVSIPSTGAFLDNSAFSGVTSQSRLVYALLGSATVSAVQDDGTGHAELTVSNTTGFNSGDALSCANVTGTPALNQSDANTTLLDSTHIILNDVAFVVTGTGTCGWVGLALATLGVGHSTDPLTGVETVTGNTAHPIVGIVYIDGSHNLNDTPICRCVMSWYNRQPKTVEVALGANVATTVRTAYRTPATTLMVGQFVDFGPPSVPGLPAPSVSWGINAGLANSSAAALSSVTAFFSTQTFSADAVCSAPEAKHSTQNQAVANDNQGYSITGASLNISEGMNNMYLCMLVGTGTATLEQNETTMYATVAQ